jgi:ZIP family zinc transporter
LHNIPEWLVTFLSTLVSFEIGLAVAFALALHKIPEWFAVSLPIYYATGNKLKAFILTSVSWMANLLWALLWYFFVQYFFSDFVLGMLFWVVAWIMLFVSFHQLLPTASQYNKHHIEVYGVLSGMVIIWFIMAFLSKV